MRNKAKTFAGFLGILGILSMTSCTFKMGGTEPSGNDNFTFRHPECNQSVKMGGTDSIMWTNPRTPLPKYVSLALFRGDDFAATIASNIENFGIYRWPVPSIGSGSDYRIRVRSTDDTAISAFSCYFNLVSEYSGGFTFSSPTASSACTTNKTLKIQWQSTGKPGNYVSLKLCDDTTVIAAIVSSASTSGGTYNWTVPANIAAKSTYRIKIASYYDPSIFAFSDKFSIAGLGVDSYEPDNNRDSASVLTLGKAQNHSLTLNDTDWVSFTLDSGTTYLSSDMDTVPPDPISEIHGYPFGGGLMHPVQPLGTFTFRRIN